ncbi:MAG TPA: tRNA lysidine(34) synthetase TilS, partial [Pyrinomonadaceae bacterium]|nr:tRNA lysidine(34) synthetase TilS [Pyrinomonadaceae bacterium]
MTTRGAHSSGGRVSTFARSLRREWRELGLPESGARVVLAVSGGADSSAMLLAFEELRRATRLDLEIVVAHLDHGLRGEAGARDARWVARLAEISNFKFEIGNAMLRIGDRGNTEQAARMARYRFLEGVAAKHSAALIAVAHTIDDQAETMLLNLLRGSGLDGLAGMEAVRLLGEGEIQLVRPLLRWARRGDTAAYCRERGVRPRADAMNRDEN